MENKKRIGQAFWAALPVTTPIFAGFMFIGTAYGLYASAEGFSFCWPVIMAIVIFGGSLEFVTVSMLLSPFAPLQTFILAFAIQMRHLFYGLSMLERYRGQGWKKPFLLFGLCDETFALNYTTKPPEGVDRGWYMLWLTWLNQFYWVLGVAIGALLGQYITFLDTHGLGFVMTAMFTVIFVDQWLREKRHDASLIGLVVASVCLIVFGGQHFIIPSLLLMTGLVTLRRKSIEKDEGVDTYQNSQKGA